MRKILNFFFKFYTYFQQYLEKRDVTFLLYTLLFLLSIIFSSFVQSSFLVRSDFLDIVRLDQKRTIFVHIHTDKVLKDES